MEKGNPTEKLIKASAAGDVDEVERLLIAGADVNGFVANYFGVSVAIFPHVSRLSGKMCSFRTMH